MFDPPVSEQNIDPVPRSTRSKDHHEDHHTHDHVHDPSVSSVSIVCEGNLDLEKAIIWLDTLLFERSEDIYRMKGLLSVQGMKERFVFQDFGALKMPTLIFLHQVYMATQAFQLAQGNTSFKEKPEIMLSSAILKLSNPFFSAFYGNEKKGENVGLNCNFQFFTLLVVKIKGMENFWCISSF
ncbi:hypothetical protein DVH24_002280 [Malus domestica]|uniref:CobW C-terminal domain-containing protein n=1 Tax=Malus domestica TaxID=3750 RepID=A0A498I962_MALDO|nr:hypothetical protein DVH24_002280 [Malus domestica]